MSDKATIPKLSNEDISEMHIVAMYAWQSDVPSVTADPAHVVALADEVLATRQNAQREAAAHKMSEANRCIRILRDVMARHGSTDGDVCDAVDEAVELINGDANPAQETG